MALASTSHSDRLRYAKKGLMMADQAHPPCPLYQKLSLMLVAAEDAWFIGAKTMGKAFWTNSVQGCEAGAAYLRIAYENSKAFVQNCPPDHLRFSRGLLLHIFLAYLWNGPQYPSLDTPEIAV